MKISIALLCTLFLLSFSSFSFAADLVVIGHPSASTLSKDQVADIYLGKV